MKIRRLGWAGIELEAGGTTAVIDLLEDLGPMTRFVGEPKQPLPGPSAPAKTIDLAIVTHLHSDHTDPAALARVLAADAVVLRPAAAVGSAVETAGTAAAEHGLREHQLRTQPVEPWETVTVGAFTATAVPAVDGFGDPQVSWVITADDLTIIHCGDTLFHGSWWLTKMRTGPIDVAFLPINGPIVSLPHRQPPSRLAAAMGPVEAAEAATILEVGVAVPIHYDTIDNPPVYRQVDDPARTFVAAATARGVTSRVLAPGGELTI
ncbi:MAG: MBL fold metallo-hydrolase [Actinomycetota bacterium]|nr:MBL fold metallo-hydrolase [Actinomycetota bacterium]